MPLVAGWASNKGVVREDNQDSCYTSVFENCFISAGIAVMCDGMGGLSRGEVASRLVCDMFAQWFDKTFRYSKFSMSYSEEKMEKNMTAVLKEANARLMRYGAEHELKLGTTASVLLIVNERYYIAHIGDSRIYGYSDDLQRLTEDDSVAEAKMRRGEINQIEYDSSSERHILTQCIGMTEKINIHFYSGKASSGDVFFLCCDGMYHCLQTGELKLMLAAQRREKGTDIDAALERLIDKIITRGEKDNISGVVICCI